MKLSVLPSTQMLTPSVGPLSPPLQLAGKDGRAADFKTQTLTLSLTAEPHEEAHVCGVLAHIGVAGSLWGETTVVNQSINKCVCPSTGHKES